MDSANKPEKQQQEQQSPAELMANAKLVAEAAIGSGSEKADKGRAAEAAADLLDAAENHGNLDKSSYGEYVDKAEDYLHKYGTTHSTAPGGGTTHSTAPGSGTTVTDTTTDTATHTASGPGGKSGEDDKSEGGVGDYLKKAQGLLGK